jgi:choline-sulfatase
MNVFQITLFTCFLSILISAQAAEITWGVAGNTIDKSQLIEGNVVYAFSGGVGATITGGNQNYGFTAGSYQDIAFTPAPGARITADVSNGAASTGDLNFDTIIKSFTDAQSGITSGTQTISGLTNGTTYQIQVFFNDQRGSSSSRVMTFGDGAAPPNNRDIAAAGSGWGQFAVGSFTAVGTTQSLTHITNGFGNVHFNAILVTAPGPPPAPDSPTNLTVAAGNELNLLNWDDNTQFGFAEFRIMRSTTQDGPHLLIGTSTESSFTDTGLTNGTTYYYVVTAVNSENAESTPSAEAQGTPAQVAQLPNFVFIIADDMGTYALNAYRLSEPAETSSNGQAYPIDTPNIDRLAAEGMLFHQARIMGADSGAVCTPSRTCIMTGKNTWQRTVGVSAATTFPGIFNRGVRAGSAPLPYATYRTCKSGNSYPTANGEFTIVDDATKRGNTTGSGSEWHGDRGLEHIEHWRTNHRQVGKPFLMYLGFSHPHDTRSAQASLTGRYGCINTTAPSTIPLNSLAPPLPYNHLPIAEASGVPANYPFHPFDHGHLDVRDENSAVGMDQFRTEAVVRNENGRNFACVDWIDQQVGRVLARLEDPDGNGDNSDSVLDNTYIVFTSDHGIAVGRHGLQGKQNLYEHTWRVPYIVRGPGIAAGSHTDALIYLHDSFPTFCDFAGIDLPPTIDQNDGQSFRAVLEGQSHTHRDELYGLYAGGSKPGIRAVTDGRFKLVKYDVSNDTTQETQLFDLQTNPFELLSAHGVPNLATAPAYARIRQQLEEKLTQQRIENADPYEFLGDRTLLRFEGNIADRFPFENNGTAVSGNGGALPAFSSSVPNTTDYVLAETNASSIDLEQDAQNYVQLADDPALNFGDAPFTIEAWVKLESLPAGDNTASSRPVVMKKALGAGDGALDYMFLAAAGHFGDATNFDQMALHFGTGIVFSTLAIPDTGWHFISVAFDPVADLVRFTLDGQTDTQATSASGTRNTGPLVIGAHFNTSGAIDSAFDGLIDELSITDGFLALGELQPLSAVAPLGDFEITELSWSSTGETLELTFDSTDTRLYHIQHSTSLEPGTWSNIRTFVPGSSGTNQTLVTELPAQEVRGFFRVASAD